MMATLFLSLRIAGQSLAANKLRSILTIGGMVIGNAAVILVVAVGGGASQMIAHQIATAGSNLLLVMPGSTTAGGVRAGIGTLPTLTRRDVAAIQAECPAVKLAAASVRDTGHVTYGNMNWSTLLQGSSQEMLTMRDWKVREGRGLTQQDLDTNANVCLLGTTVVDNLFGNEAPVGKRVRIKGIPFQVVGALEPKGRLPQGSDQDDIIVLPYTTTQTKLIGSPLPDTVGTILLQATDEASIPQAIREVTQLLDQRHHIGPAKERDFSIRDLTEILSVSTNIARIMGMLLGAVASISLLVGGIGIMNIMLVSVTERTREIGIRMAIGARNYHILLQFLVEAVLLTLAGGAIGIILGIGCSIGVSRLLHWPPCISGQAVTIALIFSSLIGIFFGYYPAHKAARLNPIEALRHE